MSADAVLMAGQLGLDELPECGGKGVVPDHGAISGMNASGITHPAPAFPIRRGGENCALAAETRTAFDRRPAVTARSCMRLIEPRSAQSPLSGHQTGYGPRLPPVPRTGLGAGSHAQTRCR